MTRTEIPIIKITLAGTPIHKGVTDSGRPGFILDVIYHLQDGRTLPGNVNRQRKKDIPRGLEMAQQSASAGSMSACFDENGEYYGTTSRWIIGGAGLVPLAPEGPADTALLAA